MAGLSDALTETHYLLAPRSTNGRSFFRNLHSTVVHEGGPSLQLMLQWAPLILVKHATTSLSPTVSRSLLSVNPHSATKTLRVPFPVPHPGTPRIGAQRKSFRPSSKPVSSPPSNLALSCVNVGSTRRTCASGVKLRQTPSGAKQKKTHWAMQRTQNAFGSSKSSFGAKTRH